MKIVFLSNFYNHHQAYLSREFYKLTNKDYTFIASTSLTQNRKNMGYPELDDDFVVLYNKNIQELIDSADVVIAGSAPEEWIENRKKHGRLIFRYSERPLKNGFEWWKYPYRFCQWHKRNPPKAQIYMLCASAYTSVDYSKFGMFKNKSFKWGYFPECKKYENIGSLISAKKENELLWCGRFLDWKHPDDVFEVARRLKAEGKNFHISIIGVGEMESKLKAMLDEYELSEFISFLGAATPDQVRGYMEKASIYLFTSDRKEGWGAVLNEAMNSACAVVASDAAGSTPYLMKNGENGLIYSYGDTEALYQSVLKLLDDPKLRFELGSRAYETIVNNWNAEIAAERFICLAERILTGEKTPSIYTAGPCSLIL